MKILGIDSSTDILAVGLADDRKIITESTVSSQREHASRIIDTISDVLNSGSITKQELTGLALAIGPGSFTGLRIGLAVAKGFAVALNIPVVGISTFEVLRQRLTTVHPQFCLMAPVRRGEFYFWKADADSEFPGSLELVEISALADRVGKLPWMMIGQTKDDLSFTPNTMISKELARISGGELALCGAKLIAGGRSDDVDSLEPLYFAPSQAERKFGQS